MKTTNRKDSVSQRALAIRLTYARWECSLVAEAEEWYQPAAQLGEENPHAALPEPFADVPEVACAFIFGQDEAIIQKRMQSFMSEVADARFRINGHIEAAQSQSAGVERMKDPDRRTWCSLGTP